MPNIRKSAKLLLKVLYKQYVNQNPIDPLSINDITTKIGSNTNPKEILATLNYLTDKEYITPLSHSKNKVLSYRLTPKGIDFYERETKSLKKTDSNKPLIYFNGDMRGQLHINSYGSYGEDHTQFHQSVQNKKSYIPSDAILDFIEWVRAISDEDIAPELKEEIEMKCDVMESLIGPDFPLKD